MKKLLLSSAITALWFLPLWSSTIHVPGDYSTIQAGINASVNGDTVLVASGVYAEHFRFNGKAICLKSASGPDETILQQVSAGIPIIRFENNEGQNSILDGFTVRNAQDCPAINMSYAGPTIIRNKFINNINSNSDGGGINAVYGPVLSIIDNIFEGNSSIHGTGGGVRTYGINLIVSGNIFRNNYAGTHGGAVHLRASNGSTVDHNLFVGNHCLSIGGALTIGEDQGTEAFNNTFDSNSDVEPHGAGIGLWYSNGCRLYNNIIVNSSGMGIHNYPPNNNTTVYSDVWNNTIDYDGLAPGDGSISADPLFVGGTPYSYELSADSPCIDTGDPDSPQDPDGTRADMGAFYFNQGAQGIAFTISDVFGSQGHIIDVPLLALGYNGYPIGGLEFHISFDQGCLEYDSINSDMLSGADINVIGGEIHLIWEDLASPLMLSDSLSLLTMRFNVTGQLDSVCAITWLSGNLTVDPLGEPYADVNYNPGSLTVAILHQICGHVVYYDTLHSVPGVALDLSGRMLRSEIADQNGAFCFDNLVSGNYLLCPTLAINDPGVTVTDIVKIRRYIIHLQSFNSPYEYVAGDVNHCGFVTVADAVKIRRYLADLEALPSGDWTFIDSSFAINDTNWQQAPHCAQVVLGDQDILNLGFIGVRMGDVDASWPESDLLCMLTDTVSLEQNTVYGMPGDTISVLVSGRGIADIAGIEMHLNYPVDALSFIDISSNVLEGSTFNGGNGSIHLVWDDIFNLVTINDGEELISMRFQIRENAPELLTISFTGAHIADETGNELQVITGDGHIRRGPTDIGDNNGSLPVNFILSQNHPNPFNPTTTIEYGLPEASQVSIDIYDLLGRKITSLADGYQPAGYHQVVWNASTAPSGIYLYKIKAGPLTATRKMLLLK